MHPDLVPWERLASPSEFEAIYLIDGEEVRNGEPDVYTKSSAEILGKNDPSEVFDIPF
jgi:hypothetical protein